MSSLISLLKMDASGVVAGEDDAKTRYTIAIVPQLRLENPNKDVLVYSNPGSVVHFDRNAASCRTNLDLGLGFEQDYETYVFDHGEFTLMGPGGFTSRCFDGDYTQDGNQVVFNGISCRSLPFELVSSSIAYHSRLSTWRRIPSASTETARATSI